MLRPAVLGTAFCLCLPFATPARAQIPGDPPTAAATLLIQVRDQSGPIALATADLLGEPRLQLPALAGLELGTTSVALRGRSDARGIARVPLAIGSTIGGASGYVHTAAGLGGLVADLQPGRAQRLELQPMGEVTTATGTEPFTLHARARLADGGLCRLPPLTGTRVRLPAGDYEVWAHSDDGWIWRRLQVRSGGRVELGFDGAPRALPVAPDTRLVPLDWPGLDLVAGQPQLLLRGAAAEAALVQRRADRWLGPHLGNAAPTSVPTRTIAADDGSLLGVLERNPSGRWLLHEAAVVRAGAVQLGTPPPGDTWLLQLGPDTAPMAAPWSSGELPLLPTTRGVPLRVRAVDRDGAPIGHLAVDWTPHGMDPAQLDTTTDERGEARFGPVHAPGRLRVSDPRFLNQQLELEAVPHDGLPLVVAAGSSLLGTATWPDGRPAIGVVVTLRDADGRLRPALRAVASDDRGAFAFAGLPDDRPLVLFASAQREGRTWSGKLERQRAGGEAVALVLRDEDPQLLPPSAAPRDR